MARILVVDDEPGIVRFVTRALKAEGFGVDSAYDGAEGLDLALKGAYELILLDLRLPVMNGVAVLTKVLQQRPEQCVVVLSALSGVPLKVRCLEAGAADYLPSRSTSPSCSRGFGRACASPWRMAVRTECCGS